MIRLSQRRARVFLASGAVALVCALLSVARLEIFPPSLAMKPLQVAAAATHLNLDSPRPTRLAKAAEQQNYEVLVQRAELAGRLLVSPPLLRDAARRAGVPPDRITGLARDTAIVKYPLNEPGSEQRASQILGSDMPYQVEVQGRPGAPVLDVYTEAPTAEVAGRLANGLVASLRSYLRRLARKERFRRSQTVVVNQLGKARGGVVAGGATRIEIAVLTFLVAFACSVALFEGIARLRSRAGHGERTRPAWPAHTRSDDWPRTSRLLPWMLAGFLALVWLTPFAAIQVNASLPIDLKLDRLVLPFIVAVWALALRIPGGARPRLKLTLVHVGVAAFVLCAFVSVALNATHLNHTLELDQTFKKLPLLVTDVSLFVIVASVIRRSEIRAFLIYTLLLAAVCSLAMIWEYRSGYNVFYDLANKLLPGVFHVGSADSITADALGRRDIVGPAAVPLEAVAMLSMALPIALVGVIRSGRMRSRILYGVAACLLLAATVSTYRKSGYIAPAVIGLTILWYNRQGVRIAKLVPLVVVAGIAVHVLAPGALGSVDQLAPDRLGASTVSDRESDWDAIRPDVWSDPAFGRGFGSYDHTRYRVLDNQLLNSLVETGIVGLVAYLFMVLSVVAAARRWINRSGPEASFALTGAAAAVSFLSLSLFFDVFSFPHANYLFLFSAGIVACMTDPPDGSENARSQTVADPRQGDLLGRTPVLPAASGAVTARR